MQVQKQVSLLKEPNHMIPDCHKWQQSKPQARAKQNPYNRWACVNDQRSNFVHWWMIHGLRSSSHIRNNRMWFTIFQTIVLFKIHFWKWGIDCFGDGTIHLTLKTESGTIHLTLKTEAPYWWHHKVYYSSLWKLLAMCLLSINKIKRLGKQVSFDEMDYKNISSKGMLIVMATQVSNVYRLHVSTHQVHLARQHYNSMQLWHDCLGHVSDTFFNSHSK